MGMYAHERRRIASKFAANQRHVNFAIHIARVSNHPEISMARGQHGFRNAPHIALVLHAVANQRRDRKQLQPMLAAKFQKLRRPRHRPVIIHDFANHAGRIEPRDARQIHGSFRLPGAHQHAAAPRPQRKNVPRPRQIFGPRIDVGSSQES